MNKYEKLIETFKQNGFTVKEGNCIPEVEHWEITGRNVLGVIISRNQVYESRLYSDSILIEVLDDFNKWKDCTIQCEVDGSDRFNELIIKEVENLLAYEWKDEEFDYDYRFIKEYLIRW